MNIGVDIDNVLSNFNDELLKEFLIHDKELRGTGIVNKNKYITKGMFDWSIEEQDSFYKANIQRIAENLTPISNSRETLDKLRNDGNRIIIVTGRENADYVNPREMTINWLKKYNFNYDDIIFTNAYEPSEKAVECLKNNIDIMIDDSRHIGREIQNVGIKVLLMKTDYNQDTTEFVKVDNWNEIYNVIKEMNAKKI